jgi:hypothetical protein
MKRTAIQYAYFIRIINKNKEEQPPLNPLLVKEG